MADQEHNKVPQEVYDLTRQFLPEDTEVWLPKSEGQEYQEGIWDQYGNVPEAGANVPDPLDTPGGVFNPQFQHLQSQYLQFQQTQFQHTQSQHPQFQPPQPSQVHQAQDFGSLPQSEPGLLEANPFARRDYYTMSKTQTSNVWNGMHIQATLSTGNLNNWDDMFANPPVPPLSGAQNHFSAGILSRPVAYPPRPQESFNRAEPKRPKGDTQVSSHEVTFMERNLSQGSATSFQSACDSCCSDGRICHEPTCIEAPDVVDTCGRCPKRPRLEHVDLARGSDVLADSHRNTSLLGLGNNFDTAYEPHCGEHSLNNGTSFLLDTLFPDCAETLRNAYHSGHDFTGVDTMSHVPIGPAQILEVGTQVPEFGVEHHVCQWSGEGGILCGKACLSAPELQAHIKECHLAALDKKTGYKCCWEGCKRAEKRAEVGGALGFTQRGKLERHMQSHTNYKCCQCEICGVEFSAEQALTQHMNARHTGKKPFECKYCGKRFPQQSAKTIHERTHTGERPLSCHICHKSFPESSNMSKHMKTHGEIGEFACNFPGCNKSYVRKNALKNHQRNDHGRACSVASTTTISTQAFSSREATTEP